MPDEITTKWLNGLDNLQQDIILKEKEYVTPELIGMILKYIKDNGINFGTDEEKKRVVNQLQSKLFKDISKRN